MRIAVVTGASSGMGREFVLQLGYFYKNLDEIWVIARSAEKLEKLTPYIKTAELYKYIGLSYYQLKDYNNALLNLNNSIILSDDDIEVKNKYNEVKDKLTNGTQNNG